jgi:hypothetical protein
MYRNTHIHIYMLAIGVRGISVLLNVWYCSDFSFKNIHRICSICYYTFLRTFHFCFGAIEYYFCALVQDVWFTVPLDIVRVALRPLHWVTWVICESKWHLNAIPYSRTSSVVRNVSRYSYLAVTALWRYCKGNIY